MIQKAGSVRETTRIMVTRHSHNLLKNGDSMVNPNFATHGETPLHSDGERTDIKIILVRFPRSIRKPSVDCSTVYD